MTRTSNGFTILELIIVVVISIVLAGIVTQSFSRVHGELGVRSAQSTFLSMHAQARAFAAERGSMVRLVVDEDDDEFRVEWNDVVTGTLEVLNQVNVGREFDVDVITGEGLSMICFTPRGVASPACNTFDGTLDVELVRGNRSTSLTVLQLGQAREDS